MADQVICLLSECSQHLEFISQCNGERVSCGFLVVDYSIFVLCPRCHLKESRLLMYSPCQLGDLWMVGTCCINNWKFEKSHKYLVISIWDRFAFCESVILYQECGSFCESSESTFLGWSVFCVGRAACGAKRKKALWSRCPLRVG